MSSFVVRSALKASLRVVPKRLYAGYLAPFVVTAGKAALGGARVRLERRAKGRWRKLTEEPYRTDGTELLAKLPAGRHRVRASIVADGRRLAASTRQVNVRRGGRRSTSARDDGSYGVRKRSDKFRLRFAVRGGGTVLRRLNASVLQFCVGATPGDNRLNIGVAQLRSVRIAPDGSVVGRLKAGRNAEVRLVAQLRGRRLRGRLTLTFSTCSGSRKLDAIRATSPD